MTEVTQQPDAPTSAPVGLTIQDLTLTLQIIQAVTARGAIKADELATVGGLYERIFKFLESVGALTRTEAPQTPAETQEPAEKPAETKQKGKKGAK